MAFPFNIRQFYAPIQPTVRQSTVSVSYSEFLPHSSLLPFIYCYWNLQTTEPLERGFIYRVVSDGCIDIFFDLDNSEDSSVMGFCKRFTQFQLDGLFQYVGVRFLPSVFPHLFGFSAADLSDRFLPLGEVCGTTAQFITSQFKSEMSHKDIEMKFNNYFLDLISTVELKADPRFYRALELILKNQGMVNVENEVDTGLSVRQLRRYFKTLIGTSPKSFCKVVRFQNILRSKPSNQSLRENKLFFDVGYYDQSHFIREFKTHYGVTPSVAFGR